MSDPNVPFDRDAYLKALAATQTGHPVDAPTDADAAVRQETAEREVRLELERALAEQRANFEAQLAAAHAELDQARQAATPVPGVGTARVVFPVGPDVKVGDLVRVVHRDTYSGVEGAEVERFGQVVGVDDAGAVRVAYFAEVSDPIPRDPNVHGRDDAPRVERA